MGHDNKSLRTFVKHVVNPALRYATHAARGPFAMLRSVGRKSGKPYATPIMVWPVADGFIIALTYGPRVDWLRNLQSAAQGTLRWHRREYVFQTPVFVDEPTARRALPWMIRTVLGLHGTHEFVKLVARPVDQAATATA
jgi:deazaflavin-dependent oxidoreductase (nitroreductase family)